MVPIRVKFGLSAGLLLLAIALWIAHPTPYAGFLVLGMAFSSVGDYCLSSINVKRRVSEPLPLGIGAFMVAHLFYTLAYIARGFSPVAFLATWLIVGAVGVVVWWMHVRRPRSGLVLNVGSLVYLLWLCGMTAAATATAIRHGGLAWLAVVGAVLFLVSDALIALTALGGKRIRNSDAWIWATYVPAQLLILLSQIALW